MLDEFREPCGINFKKYLCCRIVLAIYLAIILWLFVGKSLLDPQREKRVYSFQKVTMNPAKRSC